MSKWRHFTKAVTRNAKFMRLVDSVTSAGLRVASPPFFFFMKFRSGTPAVVDEITEEHGPVPYT